MGRWARIVCWLGAVIVLAIAVGVSACGGVIAPGDGSDSGVDAARDASDVGADVVRDTREEAADRVTRDSGPDTSRDAREDAGDAGGDVAEGSSDVSSSDRADIAVRTLVSLAVSPSSAGLNADQQLFCPFHFTATATTRTGRPRT